MWDSLRPFGRIEMAGIAFAIPAGGVLLFDWGVVPILAVAGIETAAYLLRTAFESLFATRPTDTDQYAWLPLERLREKRGQVTVSAHLPPIYPRNIPFALGIPGAIATLTTTALLIAFYLREFRLPHAIMSEATLASVGIVAVAILVRQGVAMGLFIRTEGYVGESAGSLLNRRPLAAGAVFTLLVVVVAAGQGGIQLAFFAVLGAKLVYDIIDAWTDGRYIQSRREALIGEADPELPDGDPAFVAHTASSGVLIEALILGALLAVMPPVGFVVLFAGIGAGLAIGPIFGLATATVLFAGRTILEILISRFRYSTVEYRVYPTTVVAYDRRLDAVQWQVSRRNINDVSARTALTSRFFSDPFGSVRIDCDTAESKKLPAVKRPNRLVGLIRI